MTSRRTGGILAGWTARLASALRAPWLIVAVCVLAGLGIAAGVVTQTPRAYVASTQVFVTTSNVDTTSGLYSSDQFTQSRVQSYVTLVDSPDVVGPVLRYLQLPMTEQQLASEITADAPLNKVLVNIHVRDGSAQRAAAIANAVAQQFINTVPQIETLQRATANAKAVSPLKLSVVQPAVPPAAPVSPRTTLILLVGLFGGLFVGFFLLFARQRLSRRIRGPEDVLTCIGSPPLVVIPFDPAARRVPNAVASDPEGGRAEAFRRLRVELRTLERGRAPVRIAVTAPTGGEGTSSVALNLAEALAEAGHTVVLFDLAFGSSGVAHLAGVKDAPGLTSVVLDRAPVSAAVVAVGDRLSIVAAGPAAAHTGALLAMQDTRTLIDEIASGFDYAVFDAGPVLDSANAADALTFAHRTLVVARARRTGQRALRQSVEQAARVGADVAGVVLNGFGWAATRRRSKRSDRAAKVARPDAAIESPLRARSDPPTAASGTGTGSPESPRAASRASR